MLKRVNAHAERREQSTSVLALFLSIPQLSETRIKSGRSNTYVLLLLSQPIGTFGFIGLHIIVYLFDVFLYGDKLKFGPFYIVKDMEM